MAAGTHVVPNQPGALYAIVLGTSGTTVGQNNDYTTHLWYGDDDEVRWDARYDNGGEDHAVGMVFDGFTIYVTGYSQAATSSFGPTFPNFDYLTIAYQHSFIEPVELWCDRLDYMGLPDYPLGITLYSPTSGPKELWVTGAGGIVTTQESDVLTVRYLDDGGTLTDVWSDDWSLGYVQNIGMGVTTFGGKPFIAGAGWNGPSAGYDMLSLRYNADPPGFARGWS